MRQILVITRITSSPENAESEYFPGDSNHVSATMDDIVFDMYDGLDFYDTEPQEIAKKIVEHIHTSVSEVLIVIHYDRFEDLDELLFTQHGGSEWQTARYSATNENYKTEIKPALGQVVNDPSQVNKIYNFFANDPYLEAKLNLLHQCLLPESAPASVNDLPIRLRGNPSYFSAYEAFLLIRNGKTNADTLDESYVTGLKKLRDVLLADY